MFCDIYCRRWTIVCNIWKVLVTRSCLTLCDPVDGSPSGSSVPVILQAKILERVAIPFPGDLPHGGTEPVSSTAWGSFTTWAAKWWEFCHLFTRTYNSFPSHFFFFNIQFTILFLKFLLGFYILGLWSIWVNLCMWCKMWPVIAVILHRGIQVFQPRWLLCTAYLVGP